VALLLSLLGLALYLSRWLVLYAPDKVPLFPVILATMWGPAACLVLLSLWWLVLGPTSWRTRVTSTLLVLLGGAVLAAAADPSARFFFVVHGVPAAVGLAAVALVLLGWASRGIRVVVAVVLGLAAALPWEFIRIEGFTGDFSLHMVRRSEPTAEERVRQFAEEEVSPPARSTMEIPLAVGEGDWPGFRGAERNGRAPALANEGLREWWRRPVGPGWSSVCGVGDRLFTQEQREDEEVVVCYDLSTGRAVWKHGEQARHADVPSGVGPRATPTFHKGRLYVQGARGVVSCLDANTGQQIWRFDLTSEAGIKPPNFGFSASPLVLGGRVIVHPGTSGPRLLALGAATGKKVWEDGEGTESYSSPQRAVLADQEQVVVFTGEGLFGHDPITGKELWHYEWKADATSQPVVQPLLLPNDRIVIGGGQIGTGMRCVQVKKTGKDWSAVEVWTTGITPRFNDVVYREGFLYGLDSGRLFCLEADSGELRWKSRGQYGAGQVLLVGRRLLVQAERGHLIWLDPEPRSAPRGTRVEALSDKTWNHPAVVHGKLIVRNGKEMICFGPER
jgi:outer membrane protein assembly factor BamB